jgi:DinB superfamily
MDTCDECGFTYGVLPRQELSAAIEKSVAGFGPLLKADDAVLRRRREFEQWSPLEYACHVRDILLMQRDRLFVALVEEQPSFKPMYRDERTELDRYNAQSPSEVRKQLTMAAGLFSHVLSTLTDDQWGRPLDYGYPDPEVHDVEWVGHHTLHEVAHHLLDVTQLVEVP